MLQNEYLVAENRILRAHLPQRLRLTDPQRLTLAEIGKRLGREGLAEIALVAKPETILAWYKKRLARRVRFTTAAALVNELVEAKHNNQVRRMMARWQRYELIAVNEVGYVPLADVGAEFLFQLISERAEKAALIVTTNLPFSEWMTVFPNPRLCKALLDRITDRAHIVETGTESFRFRRTMERRKKKA